MRTKTSAETSSSRSMLIFQEANWPLIEKKVRLRVNPSAPDVLFTY